MNINLMAQSGDWERDSTQIKTSIFLSQKGKQKKTFSNNEIQKMMNSKPKKDQKII